MDFNFIKDIFLSQLFIIAEKKSADHIRNENEGQLVCLILLKCLNWTLMVLPF